MCNGFTHIAWAVCYIFITRFFSRPSVKEVVYSTTLFCCVNPLNFGAEASKQVAPDTDKGLSL